MEYIIIVGGQLHNKGAQAMTYTVVDAMKKKFPEKEVVLFASVYTDRDEKERHILNFRVLPWTLRQKMNFLNVKDKFIAGAKENIKQIVKGTGISKETIEQTKDILNNATSMIDISGYALSSQRGESASLNYLFNIIIAQKYNIPMFLMPQSFGPFEYDNKKKMINLIQNKLNYPTEIFAREQDGLNKLTDLGLKNIELTLDTVLQAKDEIQVSNIYKNKELLKLKVLNNSISIIPNDKIMEHGDKNKIFSIYKSLVSKALLEGKNIYLIRHSYEDLYICKQIKNEFKNEERVILVEEDLDCLEINDTLKQFDYIIASRYHSIIHGYRNGVPAIVLGWAIKYQELLNRFKQDMYLFDVRGSLNETDVNDSFDLLNKNYSKESEEIKDTLKQIHSIDIFKEVV